MANIRQLEFLHNLPGDCFFIDTKNNADERVAEEGPNNTCLHHSKTDGSPLSVTIFGFKDTWRNASDEVSLVAAEFYGLPQDVIKREITAAIQPGLC